MRIIAFGHRKRTGKDTAVKFALSFARQYFPQLQCDRLSFGDQLKKVSYQMFAWGGLEEAVYYANHPEAREVSLPAIGLTPREIWDKVGSMGADICPRVWPEMALQNVGADILFVPDLRRPAEVDYVRKFNGLCYRVDRDSAPVSNHIVDTALAEFDAWDGVIENHGSLKEYNKKIKTIVATALNIGQKQGFLVCPSCYAKGMAVMTAKGFICSNCEEEINDLSV